MWSEGLTARTVRNDARGQFTGSNDGRESTQQLPHCVSKHHAGQTQRQKKTATTAEDESFP